MSRRSCENHTLRLVFSNPNERLFDGVPAVMREGSKPDRAETDGLGLRREPDPSLATTGEGRARLE